MLIRTGK